jgi:hypothetical protein
MLSANIISNFKTRKDKTMKKLIALSIITLAAWTAGSSIIKNYVGAKNDTVQTVQYNRSIQTKSIDHLIASEMVRRVRFAK